MKHKIEKIIEKEVFITDDIQITELTNKLTQLEEEKRIFSTKTLFSVFFFHYKKIF